MKRVILSSMIIFLSFCLANGSGYAFSDSNETNNTGTFAAVTWYFDSDSDGYGDPNNSTENITGNIFLWVLNDSDCDDTDPGIYLGAPEIAGDGIDQDCDGEDDLIWYLDSDKDGFGDPAKTKGASTKPLGYVTDNGDCNDLDATIFPGAPEIAGDGIDQDCDNKDASLIFAGVLKSDRLGGIAPVDVEFNALMAQGTPPFSYEYDFDDGNKSLNGKKIETHTYTKNGSYNAKVKVTDSAGSVYEFISKRIIVVDSSILDKYLAEIALNVNLMAKAATLNEMYGILNDVQNIILKSLEPLKNANATLKKKVEDAIQTLIDNLTASAITKLKALIAAKKATSADLASFATALQGVVTSMVENGLPVLEATLEKLASISEDLYLALLDQLLANEGLTQAEIDEIKNDKAKAQAFFLSKKYLLDDLVEASGIPVVPSPDFDPDDVEKLAANHGLTDKQAANLYNAVELTLDISKLIASSKAPAQQKTIAQIVEELFNTYSGKTVVKSTIEAITQNILLEFSDGTFLSLVVKSIAIVKDYMPMGLFDLPNGNKLGVNDSFAIELASYPVFPFDFAAEIIKLGINPVLKLDGSLQVDLSQSGKFSSKIGWGYFKNNGFASLTTSFSVVGGADPSAKAYSYLVTYDTGLSQLLPPAVFAMDAFTKTLDSLIPGGYSIDTDTGVITVGTFILKPDYTFSTLTSIDYTAITAAGGVVQNNQAFEMADFNNDGLIDIKFYSDSPMGSQVLYSVSN